MAGSNVIASRVQAFAKLRALFLGTRKIDLDWWIKEIILKIEHGSHTFYSLYMIVWGQCKNSYHIYFSW